MRCCVLVRFRRKKLKKWIKLLLSSLSLLLLGCDKDFSLEPPVGDEKLKFMITLPSDVKPLPLGIMYRSNICKQVRTNANGESYEVAGFKFIELEINKMPKAVDYESEISFDGGGECSWKLSNISASFKYRDDSSVADGVTKNNPVKTIFTFDDNSPQVSDGTYQTVNSNAVISDDYYPLITIYNIPQKNKTLNIKRNKQYNYYKITNANKIKFSPAIHSNNITTAIQPEKNQAGLYFKVVYSDGVVKTQAYFPDFDKLKSLK